MYLPGNILGDLATVGAIQALWLNKLLVACSRVSLYFYGVLESTWSDL